MNVIKSQAARISGSLFVVLVLGIIAIVYYPYVFHVWGPGIAGKTVSHRQNTTEAGWSSLCFTTSL